MIGGAVAQQRLGRRRSGYGTPYRGREGQWSWIFHRVTGVAIILFLFAHVVDTAVVGWGPEAYNRVIAVYHNPLIRLLELGLVAAVIYHALNGLRIMITDFWPKANDVNRQLIYGTTALFVLSMIPITIIIVKPIVEKYL
jgi:succinate dehydrogenase / fumarate reductase cytochrome b subunit